MPGTGAASATMQALRKQTMMDTIRDFFMTNGLTLDSLRRGRGGVMKNLSLLVFAALALVFGGLGCDQAKRFAGDAFQWTEAEPALFANRPQTQTHVIAIVKLASPPLLNDLANSKERTVSADRLKQIATEQTQAEADLKEISSEIRVLYRYRMVLNALTVVVPISVAEKLKSAMNVVMVESEGHFTRPILPRFSSLLNLFNEAPTKWAHNSAAFIGAEKLRAEGVTGKGLRVGVIDTGIDYTHKMFGGAGTAEAYKAIDPSSAAAGFPSAKVVGGTDLVGTKYDSGSGDFQNRIPIPDANPLDEGGHGTHVAGTIAGLGDGVESYTGVAPDALLYAIKVFGANGSTGDAVVIAGLEYAADPNGDGKLDDQLNVVNLSLGSDYGSKHLLYGEAVKTLSDGGTSLVISAGNSGDEDYIVGSPGTSEEAISVAASIDDMEHNWKFRAVEFLFSNGSSELTALVEGPISKPVEETTGIRGELVPAGLADKDFDEELKAKLQGKIALIDRGGVPFIEKLKRAEAAGALAAIVVNNTDGEPIAMGGEGEVAIPAGMVSKALGDQVKAAIAAGQTVEANFATDKKIEKPELVDTITDFSSRGPRSIDALMKPELSAPGSSIVSAEMGSGDKGVQLSGTSMAAPHVTGAVALLMQKYPGITSQQVKSLLMGTTHLLVDAEKKAYSLTRQGTGRIQVDEAAEAGLVLAPESVSLGELTLKNRVTFARTVKIQNLLDRARVLTLKSSLRTDFIQVQAPSEVSVPAGGEATIKVEITVLKPESDKNYLSLEAVLDVFENEKPVQKLPVLAVARSMSQVKAHDLLVKAGGPEEAAGAAVTLALDNHAAGRGEAYLFNLLAKDDKKIVDVKDPFLGSNCDLEAVGYRIVDREVEGQKFKSLQVVGKLYDAFTTWHLCELNVQIDSDGDGVSDQELAALPLGMVPGVGAPNQENVLASVLLDAPKARALRKAYEEAAAKDPKKAEESYADAAIDAIPLIEFNHSSVILVEAAVDNLAVAKNGHLKVKIATTSKEGRNIEADDFLQGGSWLQIPMNESEHAYNDLPSVVALASGEAKTVSITRGARSGQLMVILPQNTVAEQMKILRAKYLKP